MGFPWKKLLGVGKALAGAFLPGIVISSINAIEDAAGEMKGGDKKAAVLKMAAAAVEGIEGAAEQDVVNNPAVVQATSNFIDAYVALMNAMAAVKAAKTPDGP